MIEKIEQIALENNIPIINKKSINYIKKIISENKIRKILEIGSAIGYSAIQMALVDEKIKITTIEKDEKRYQGAKKNIKLFGLEKQITIIFGDAKTIKLNQKFDLIFIDAAKSSNELFFEKWQKNLNNKGYIITDNINFELGNKGIKRLEKLVEKTKQYRQFLIDNHQFETKFIDIGDGLSISKRR